MSVYRSLTLIVVRASHQQLSRYGFAKMGVTRPIEVNLSHKSDGLKRSDVAFGLAYRLIGSQQGFVMIRLIQFLNSQFL